MKATARFYATRSGHIPQFRSGCCRMNLKSRGRAGGLSRIDDAQARWFHASPAAIPEIPMQPEETTPFFVSLIPLMIMTVVFAIGSFFLAKEKGRSRLKWTILACIPVVNFFTIWMLVGVTNLHTERKLDRVLALLERSPANH